MRRTDHADKATAALLAAGHAILIFGMVRVLGWGVLEATFLAVYLASILVSLSKTE